MRLRSKGNVLVADGTAEGRATARRLLRADGFHVVCTGRSDELVALLATSAPDCLLLAADLPSVGGFELCRQLKAADRAGPPLLLVLGADPAERALGLAAGADDFLARPFLRAELLARVRAHTAAHQRAGRLAARAAVLAEQNHQLAAELAVARQVQQHLLPPCLPAVDGLWMGALYEPSQAVSGDFYDLRVLGPGRVGVLLADVEGHGVPAAMVTALLKVLFHNLTEGSQDPGQILTAMNEQLTGLFAGTPPAAVTALCAIFDLRAGRVLISRAGHPPAALLHQDQVDLPEPEGYPLGWFPGGEYRTATCPLQAGDRVLLYTDGIFEALGVGDGSGLTSLSEFLSHHAAASGPELMAAMAAVARAAPGRQDDLSTLLVQVRERGT